MNIGHVQNYKIINCSWKINVLVLIRSYWWENWSEINKRTGTFIRNSRVLHQNSAAAMISNRLVQIFRKFYMGTKTL